MRLIILLFKGKKTVKRKLSPLEKAGIPKGERNSPSPYKQIGTATEPKSQLEHIGVDNPLFGKLIGKGGQQTVFENTSNPDKVLKVVTDRKFTSIPEIRQFHKEWMKRNRLPLQERIDFQGYLQGKDRIYPVSLNVGDINPWNIGYNKNGTLRFFDADVYKSGGRIIFRDK